MFALMTNKLPNLTTLQQGGSQCFPFYTYDEDGSNRRENITDWALAQFRAHYRDDTIGKWDIFHYVYGLLHHPTYRERYQANLKRDLPHLPYTPDFWAFAKARKRLGRFTSVMRRWTHIRCVSSKHRIHRSIGVWRRCGCRRIRRG